MAYVYHHEFKTGLQKLTTNKMCYNDSRLFTSMIKGYQHAYRITQSN